DPLVRLRDDVPRAWADELREVVLVPRDVRRGDLSPVVGEDARIAAVELGEPDEVLLLDVRGRRGHDAAVELAEIAGELAAARAGEVEPVSLAPWVGAQEE